MANDPDMGEAISDIYADCERKAAAEAKDFADGKFTSGDDPTKSDAELLREWTKSRRNARMYIPSRSLQLLHDSRHLFRGIRGVVGNGKTHGCEVDIVMRCATQRPCADGHLRNRCLMARGTYQELKQTTFDMWMHLFPQTKIALSSPIHGELEMRLGNKMSYIELMGFGMDMASVESKLRSNDFSIAFANEAQYISYDVIGIIMERLGRYPRSNMAPDGAENYFLNLGLTCDTNSPVEGSWWYERAERVKNTEDEYFIDCPPAMFRTWNPVTKTWLYEENRGQRWKTHGIPPAENVEHLNEGWEYYWKLIRTHGDDYIRRNILNEYGHVLSGTPVFPEFSKTRHVPDSGVPLPPNGAKVYCGMDLGRHPRAVFAYYDAKNGGVRIFRILSRDCGVKMFAETVMRPNLMSWGISPARVTIIPDPAGENPGEQVEATSVEILKAAGFDVAMPVLKNNDPFTRLETVRQALTRTANDGDPYLTVDMSCEELIRALAGGYTYQIIRQAGGQQRTGDKPDKNCPYSHIADALQYLLVGMKYGRRDDRVFGSPGTSYYTERLARASNGHDSGLFF